MVNQQVFPFPGNMTLLDFKVEYMKNHPSVFDVKLVSSEGLPYHDSTLLSFVTEDSFKIILNNTDCFMVLNFKDNEIFDNEPQPMSDGSLQNLLKAFGSSVAKRGILSNFTNQLIEDVLTHKGPNGTINAQTLKKLIQSKILTDNIKLKTDMKRIDDMLKILYAKKGMIDNLKAEVKGRVEKRSSRRLKYFYSLILAQLAFTQYGTYVKYSWDIMEPICLLFGIMDSILAYAYWMSNNNDYSLEQIEGSYYESYLNKYFKKHPDIRLELDDVEKMIDHLEVWKSLHSESLPEILQALDRKFDTVL